MQPFQALGAEIEETWLGQNYNEEVFPSIAAEALIAADLPSKIAAWDIVEWTLKQTELPPQKDPHANFADPPITVFVAPRFYIDAYFWLDGTTQIHQHAFSGAFQVLLGSSLHSSYEFERTESVNVFTEVGQLRLRVCELLKVGDVKPILAGRQYIHSLFHLDQPSVTVVVRTDKSPLHRPQFSYYKPSLAIDPFFEHETTTKKLQTIRALYTVQHAEADALVAELLGSSDFQTSFAILSTVREFLGGTPLGQLFNLESHAARFNSLLEIVARRHGSKANGLAAIFEHRDRLRDIVRRRNYVTDAGQRYFLAVLLNVDGLKRILSLIKQRFPESEPIEKVLDLVHDLAQTRVVGVNTPNALGIEAFDDLDLSILEHLLRGSSDAEARERVVTEYGETRSAGIDDKLVRIRESAILGPLISE
jgi:hypothetical protein